MGGRAGLDAARPETALLRHAWARRINSPECSSVGRLFDAAAALLGLASDVTFEGQAPMLLEAASGLDPAAMTLPLTQDPNGVWRTDWAPLLPVLADTGRDVQARAALFHATLAAALVAQASIARAETGINRMGLTGGVFQNRLLAESVISPRRTRRLRVFLPERLPCNDAGLSFGQLIEASACTGDRFVTLAHGNGGRLMRALIEQVFAAHLANPDLDVQADAARLTLPPGDVLMTTDGFTVQPLEFPGGDIGSLAVHGTVNDLAVSGRDPVLSQPRRVHRGRLRTRAVGPAGGLDGAGRACGRRARGRRRREGASRGECGGLYLATTASAFAPARRVRLGIGRVRAGDVLLVSGPVGDHGTAVLLAREEFGLRGDLRPTAHACWT